MPLKAIFKLKPSGFLQASSQQHGAFILMTLGIFLGEKAEIIQRHHKRIREGLGGITLRILSIHFKPFLLLIFRITTETAKAFAGLSQNVILGAQL